MSGQSSVLQIAGYPGCPPLTRFPATDDFPVNALFLIAETVLSGQKLAIKTGGCWQRRIPGKCLAAFQAK
jgi:hypothetical protein